MPKGARDCTALLEEGRSERRTHLLPHTLEKPHTLYVCDQCHSLVKRARVLEMREEFKTVCEPCLQLISVFMKIEGGTP